MLPQDLFRESVMHLSQALTRKLKGAVKSKRKRKRHIFLKLRCKETEVR